MTIPKIVFFRITSRELLIHNQVTALIQEKFWHSNEVKQFVERVQTF